MNITNTKYFESLSKIEKPSGLIVISHGMAEHIGRYAWVIDKLNHDGFHVIAKDHLGSSFDLEKSIGYKVWKTDQEKTSA